MQSLWLQEHPDELKVAAAEHCKNYYSLAFGGWVLDGHPWAPHIYHSYWL